MDNRTTKLLEAKGFARREKLSDRLNKKEFKDIKLFFKTIEKRLNKFIRWKLQTPARSINKIQ